MRKRIRKPTGELAAVEGLPLLMQNSDRQEHWSFWHREVDAYRSDLLVGLKGDLRAPRCESIEETDNGATLWLQDLAGAPARTWDVRRFARAARGLGALQGRSVIHGSSSRNDWYSRGTPRAELTHDPAEPGDETLIAWLEASPQTLCHFDLWSANLIAGATAEMDDATYVLDWSAVGVGPLGYDLANLVFDSVWMCQVTPDVLPALVPEVLDAYVSGLRLSGWRGDAGIVRRAYAIVAELKFVRLKHRLERNARDRARHDRIASMYDLPASDVFARRRATIEFAASLFATT